MLFTDWVLREDLYSRLAEALDHRLAAEEHVLLAYALSSHVVADHRGNARTLRGHDDSAYLSISATAPPLKQCAG